MPKESFDKLAKMREKALEAGGEERIKRQHEAGKYTARERIDKLLDPGSFVEIDEFVVHRDISVLCALRTYHNEYTKMICSRPMSLIENRESSALDAPFST